MEASKLIEDINTLKREHFYYLKYNQLLKLGDADFSCPVIIQDGNKFSYDFEVRLFENGIHIVVKDQKNEKRHYC